MLDRQKGERRSEMSKWGGLEDIVRGAVFCGCYFREGAISGDV